MMSLLSVLLILATKWSISESNDQCCYFYGSAPHNDSNCVPEGGQLPLNYTIYNPRDSFTNLSVRWFRSNNMSALAENITNIQSTEYIFRNHTQGMTILQRNCTQGRLYADTFALIINNFTTNKNGYYWCQIFINDSFLNPSQHTWFYAKENTSCTQQDPYFRAIPDRAQCASEDPTTNIISTIPLDDPTDGVTTTMSTSLNDPTNAAKTMSSTLPNHPTDAVTTAMSTISLEDHTNAPTTTTSTTSLRNVMTTTMSTTPAMTSTLVLTTLASENAVTSSEPILYYAIGILAALVLLVGTLAILIIIFYTYKSQKEKKQRNQVTRHECEEMDAIASTNQETLAGESSGMAAIVNYENVESATFLGNRSITPTIVTDDQQDHTYDTPEFHSQTEMLHEQPQYNTLQCGNNGKITNYGMRFDAYDKVEIHASKHVCNCSTFIKQAPRSIHQTDSYYYDDVGATFTHENKMERVPQMVPQDYVIEPVYHELNNTQADKPTCKQPVFDDEAYGMHKQVSNGAVVQPGIDSFESKSHSEITTTVKEDMPTDNKEVEYAEPLAPNDKSHTQDTQGKGEHFYHSLELNEPIKSEKCISGAPLSNKSSNPSLTMEEKMQTLHHILSPEEASCIGDVNDDPELLNYEEDTNAPEYSDPLDSECTDDINMAKDQRDTIAKFNIYDIFDDSTYA